MAKKSNKKTQKKEGQKTEKVETVEIPKEKTVCKKESIVYFFLIHFVANNDYQPGFLSNLLSKQTIDSKPVFESEAVEINILV